MEKYIILTYIEGSWIEVRTVFNVKITPTTTTTTHLNTNLIQLLLQLHHV